MPNNDLFLPILVLVLACAPIVALEGRKEAYLAQRDDFLERQAEANSLNSPLNVKEQALNTKLVEARDKYIRRTKGDHSFEPHHYFYSWDLDELHKSEDNLFGLISSLPKGGALHLHSGSSGSVDWIVEEGILIDGCYVFYDEDDATRCIEPVGGQEVPCGQSGTAAPLLKGTIAFYTNGTEPKGFTSARDLIIADDSFRSELRALLTSNGSLEAYDSAQAWEYFNKIFVRIGPAMAYQPFYYAYLLNTFTVHSDDNVQHIEIRALCGTKGLGDMYVLGSDEVISGDDVVDTYRQALKNFQSEVDPNFTMKLIISSLRVLDPETIEEDVEEAVRLYTAHPDLLIGFDLVAEEDPNHRTLDYLDVWMQLMEWEEKLGFELPLYFHDGESNDRNNTNIVDAVMLGSKRIGHGVNSYFFPVLFDEMKANNAVLEVNPLSNQILRYVDNLELHPVNGFIASGVDVVLAADDPGAFGYTGLSYDWWAGMMAFQLDLSSLKQLALNSLTYSGLEGSELDVAMSGWEKSWDNWVDTWLQKL